MTVLEQLKAARALISERERWTTNFKARTHRDRCIGPLEVGACKWCAVGAIEKVGGVPCDEQDMPTGPYWQCLYALQKAILEMPEVYQGGCFISMPSVNDYLSHDAVMKVFDKAIEMEAAK